MVRYDPVCGMGNFNPHSQEGSDGTRRKDCGALYRISIHTPKKGVTWKVFKIFLWYNDFNPHSQEGSDNSPGAKTSESIISIHTPKKGVTSWQERKLRWWNISIHTPKKGVTNENLKSMVSDLISIHTPKKGVTGLATRNILRIGYFNPHSQEGSDFGLLLISPFAVKFQSTLPRREWRIVGVELEYFYKHFNPHSQEGSDAFKRGLEEYKRISIHTPKKGVTTITLTLFAVPEISIHTPKKGVTIVVIRGSTLR